MINQLFKEELRSVCNCPKKFQLLDIGGAAFGIFFMIDGFNRLNKGTSGWAGVELAVGAIMALVHTTKFFHKDQLGIK